MPTVAARRVLLTPFALRVLCEAGQRDKCCESNQSQKRHYQATVLEREHCEAEEVLAIRGRLSDGDSMSPGQKWTGFSAYVYDDKRRSLEK